MKTRIINVNIVDSFNVKPSLSHRYLSYYHLCMTSWILLVDSGESESRHPLMNYSKQRSRNSSDLKGEWWPDTISAAYWQSVNQRPICPDRCSFHDETQWDFKYSNQPDKACCLKNASTTSRRESNGKHWWFECLSRKRPLTAFQWPFLLAGRFTFLSLLFLEESGQWKVRQKK